jgi:hypothetical protein
MRSVRGSSVRAYCENHPVTSRSSRDTPVASNAVRTSSHSATIVLVDRSAEAQVHVHDIDDRQLVLEAVELEVDALRLSLRERQHFGIATRDADALRGNDIVPA